ncbi:MAG TPA: AAA family ATPase [Gemmataceae bacterium]|nr:AAA family ATPase [Gemmataceae bacterium]
MSPLDSSKSASHSRPTRAAAPSTEERPPEADEAPGGIPAVLTRSPTFGALLAALGRRWLLALCVALLGASLTTAALLYFVPARYVSELRLQLRRPPEYMPGSGDNVAFDDYIRSQALLLRSSRVINATLDQPEVAALGIVARHGDDRTWITRDLVIKPTPGENVLLLKLSADDAKEASKLLAALVEEYLKVIRAERSAQLALLTRSLAADEAALRGLPGGNSHELEQVVGDLARVRINLRLATAELDLLSAPGRNPDPKALSDAVNEILRDDPEAQRLHGKIFQKKQEYEEYIAKAKFGKDEPKARDLLGELKQLEDDLGRQRTARLGQARESEEQRLRKRIKLLEAERDVLLERLGQPEGGPDPEQRARVARRKVIEGVRDTTQRNITRIERDGQDVPWVVKLGPPTAPSSRDWTLPLKVVPAGTVAVVGLLLFGVALVDCRGRRALSSDEVTLGLGIPTVGALPLVPARARQAGVLGAAPREPQWQGQLTEAVDAVRTLLLQTLGDGPKVLLVTSAVGGEGKTSLARQLAASLARAWRKTLLIDADLRKPAAHQLFDLPPDPGFSEVLRGDLEPSATIKPTAVGRLWLMPAGQWDPHAQQALAQDGVGNLFEHLKDEYDAIIVDSCPVLPVADTLLLGQHVDTVLLSVLKGTSRLPTVYAARQRLAALNIPVLGAVFAGGSGALGGLDIQYPRPAVQ